MDAKHLFCPSLFSFGQQIASDFYSLVSVTKKVGKESVTAVFSLTQKTPALCINTGRFDPEKKKNGGARKESDLEENLKQMQRSGKIPLDKPFWFENVSPVMS